MKKTALLLLSLAGLLLAPRPACAAEAPRPVYAPYFDLINVHPDYRYPTSHLFKSYVDNRGKYRLILDPRPDSTYRTPSLDSARVRARELGCDLVLLGTLNRLGETVILSMTLHEAQSGKPLWQDMLKAASPEDLDPILQRVAAALGSPHKAAQAGDIYSVSDYESPELRKVQANRYLGFSINGSGLLTYPYNDEPFTAGFGLSFLYDTRHLLLGVEGQLNTFGANKLPLLALSIYRPLNLSGMSPIFGGGVGLGGLSNPAGEDGSGPFLHTGIGYLFNRTSNVGVRVMGRYILGLFDTDAEDEAFPQALQLNMEILFGR